MNVPTQPCEAGCLDNLHELEQSMTPFEFQRRWVLLLRQEALFLKRAAMPSERSGLADSPSTPAA